MMKTGYGVTGVAVFVLFAVNGGDNYITVTKELSC
jgi:hypothetical protein